MTHNCVSMATSSDGLTRALDDLVRAVAKQRSEANTLRLKLLRMTTQRDKWKASALGYRKRILEGGK